MSRSSEDKLVFGYLPSIEPSIASVIALRFEAASPSASAASIVARTLHHDARTASLASAEAAYYKAISKADSACGDYAHANNWAKIALKNYAEAETTAPQSPLQKSALQEYISAEADAARASYAKAQAMAELRIAQDFLVATKLMPDYVAESKAEARANAEARAKILFSTMRDHDSLPEIQANVTAAYEKAISACDNPLIATQDTSSIAAEAVADTYQSTSEAMTASLSGDRACDFEDVA
jgi:hypothetical protein